MYIFGITIGPPRLASGCMKKLGKPFGRPGAGAEARSPAESPTEIMAPRLQNRRANPNGAEDMGKIDDACKNVVNEVDGALACGIVDLDSGMLLGIHNAAGYTQSLNELVAGATMDMFRGPNLVRIEQAVRAHRGQPEDGSHYFDEIHVTSKNNFHFAKTIKNARYVIVLVTRKTTSLGMGWASLKAAIPTVEPLLP